MAKDYKQARSWLDRFTVGEDCALQENEEGGMVIVSEISQ
jgi:hypothetical protein